MAFPTLGRLSIEWVAAREGLLWPMNCGRGTFFWKDEVGGQIAEGRNVVVQRILNVEDQGQYTVPYIFFLDDDVLCPPGALLKLLSHNADVASGVYFGKTDNAQPLIFPGPGCGTLPFVPDQVTTAYGWSMGLSVVRTEVFRRCIKELDIGVDKYGNPNWFAQPSEYKFLDGVVDVGGTEDFAFFEKVHRLGIKPVIDTSCHTVGWHWCSERNTAFPREQWEQYRDGKPVVWNTPGGPVVWEQGVRRV